MAWFPEPHFVAPGARERIEERLKDIPRINQERPCSKCLFWDNGKLIKCSRPIDYCDFEHSGFKEIAPDISNQVK